MNIAVVNGKGGSGKTTLTILLASALTEAGQSVGIDDTDPQQTAKRWMEEAGGQLELLVPHKEYGTILVDTPPRLESTVVLRAIREADIVLVVTSPSPADLWTSRDTAEMLRREGCEGKARLVFNQVQAKTVLSRELDEMARRIGLEPLKSRLQRRQCYQHAVIGGWRMLPPDARDEVFKVALEITAIPRTVTPEVAR